MAIAVGLLVPKVWACRLILTGTAVYTLDRLIFLLDSGAREAYLAKSGVTGEVAAFIDVSIFHQGIVLAILVSVLCWWGFALYIYLRRDYFQQAV